MSRTRAWRSTAAALALISLSSCAAEDSGTDDTSTSGADGGAIPVVPAEVGHVHGIAVNPADGLLYLGTHGGPLVVEDGAVTPVGDSTIDLMGFTIAGPDHFYASGHPGPADDLPQPVGLIESVDGGQTWRQLSLGGQADFHTLGAAGEQVYGFTDRLVASSDGRTWKAGDADVFPASLAADPSRPERVVATTQDGPVLSEDAAKSFSPLAGAPLLLFVAWPTTDALWGVGVDGSVHLSSDAGDSWVRKGAVETPTAFTATEDGTVVVATETEIVASDDGGRTFEPVAELAHGGS